MIVGDEADVDGTPVTTPVTISTVANAVLLLLHVPPAVASVSVIDKPPQTVDGPAIDTGSGSTDIVRVAIQPVGNV